jgi:hypothetical protein
MGIGGADLYDAANWRTPRELPDLRRVGIAALDTETRDEGLSVRAIACFRDPDQMRAAVIKLIEQGFDANVRNEIDDENRPAIWINTIVTTELDCTSFIDSTDHAIPAFRGGVVEIETFGAEE